MDGLNMTLMSLGMLIGPLVLLAAVAGAISVGVRAAGGSGSLAPEDSARATLARRLAAGEVSPDEYLERESALRSGESGSRGRSRSLGRRPVGR